MDFTSQDLFDPESTMHNTDLQPDCDSETPDFLLQDAQPAVTSPKPPAPPSHHADPCGTAVLPHVQFLQSLCALRRVEESSRGLESLWFQPDGDAASVLVESVCQLLDSVVQACRDPPPLGPRDLILHACQVVAQAMDLFCSQRLPTAEFLRRVEEPLRELTGMLLHCNQLSRVSTEIHREEPSACTHYFLINVTMWLPQMENEPSVRAAQLKGEIGPTF